MLRFSSVQFSSGANWLWLLYMVHEQVVVSHIFILTVLKALPVRRVSYPTEAVTTFVTTLIAHTVSFSAHASTDMNICLITQQNVLVSENVIAVS